MTGSIDTNRKVFQGYTFVRVEGVSPLFFPLSEAEAKSEVGVVLSTSPRLHGIPRVRWRLQDVGRALAWLEGKTEAGIYKVLKRLGFSRKRAMNFIRSPDPEYRAKWQAILRAFQEAVAAPDQVVILFLDELTYYRRPTTAEAYHPKGKSLPLAIHEPGANTKTRVVAVLNALTGQVTYRQRSTVGKDALIAFYKQVRDAYPNIEKCYIVQDNWPTHKLPEVFQAMEEHKLTPLFLPTYASWLNPIEKLWRWLKQDVLHLHMNSANIEQLRSQVTEFLDQFHRGSDSLLRYVGLFPD